VRSPFKTINRGGTQLLIDALAFAAYKHRRQRRKDAEASPYINHPIALAHVLTAEAGITNAKILAAAILHDTIEDTETSYEELRERFGRTIAGVVREVTDDKTLSKADRKRLQIEHAEHLSRRARLVKLADKISNVRDIAANPPHDWPLQRRREYFDWAKAVVDRIRKTNRKLERAFDEAYAGRP
jgi:GTP diphosphokinase / guanosine-3',5'-bis(diphosphate) 3'-diphosphatase